jgi:hypothetical protein
MVQEDGKKTRFFKLHPSFDLDWRQLRSDLTKLTNLTPLEPILWHHFKFRRICQNSLLLLSLALDCHYPDGAWFVGHRQATCCPYLLIVWPMSRRLMLLYHSPHPSKLDREYACSLDWPDQLVEPLPLGHLKVRV